MLHQIDIHRFSRVKMTSVCFTLALVLSACTSDSNKYASYDEGVLSAKARNNLAANNPQGLLNVGQGFEKSGNLQEALNLYAKVMAVEPAMLEAEVSYARVLGKLGAYDKALFMLVSLFDEHPDNIPILLTLAKTYIDSGQYEAADRFLSLKPLSGIEDPSLKVQALLLSARLKTVLSPDADTLILFEQALEEFPESREALLYTAQAFALKGNYETAISLLQKVMDTSEYERRAQLSIASIYAMSGQISAAMQLTRSLVSPEAALQRLPYYRSLSSFDDKEKAMALMFNDVSPETVLKYKNASPVMQ